MEVTPQTCSSCTTIISHSFPLVPSNPFTLTDLWHNQTLLVGHFFILQGGARRPSWLQREDYTYWTREHVILDTALLLLHTHANKHAQIPDWSLQNGLYGLTLCDIPLPQATFICYFPTMLCMHLARDWDHIQVLQIWEGMGKTTAVPNWFSFLCSLHLEGCTHSHVLEEQGEKKENKDKWPQNTVATVWEIPQHFHVDLTACTHPSWVQITSAA